MRVLYGRHYADRMRAVADQVPAGASVLELCCGPGTLYRRYLRGRAARTSASTSTSGSSAACTARGDRRTAGRPRAHATSRCPTADVAIMQASLYHFLPDAGAIVDRMLAAARQRVIVSEPIRNLASSGLPLIGLLGRRAADPGAGGHERPLHRGHARRADGAATASASSSVPHSRRPREGLRARPRAA